MAASEHLRIGIDTLFESPKTGTGGLVYLRNIVKAIGEVINGEIVFLFTSPANAHIFSELPSGVSLVNTRCSTENSLLRIFSQQVVLPFLARRLNLDVLLCPGNVLPMTVKSRRVLIVQNRLQYDLPRELGMLRRFYRGTLGRLSLDRAAKIVALSYDLGQYLQETLDVPASRIIVIPGGVNRNLFVPRQVENKLNSEIDKRYLLVVGTLWPYKNHEVLIRALALYHRRHGFSGKLVIVGGDWKGRMQKLRCLALELRIENKVEFLGYVLHETMPQIYADAGALLYPSLAECFPLPVVEAMASGVPVIASNRCSLPEVVGDAGICLDPHDEKAWADAIYRVMTDGDLHGGMIERGLIRAGQYTWRAAGQKILEVLREVTQAP